MITSSQNPKVKLARALSGRAKERREARAFIVEGVRLTEEAFNAIWPIRFILYDESLSERGRLLVERLSTRGVETENISPTLMKSLSDTEISQGILAVLDDFKLPIPDPLNFVLIPDQIRDPGNLGTLLRSACAAGAQAVFLPPETTDVFAPKVVRAGMGAHFRLPIRSMSWEEIMRSAKDGLRVFLADMNGASCWETDLQKPLALVIGGEVNGVSDDARKLANQKISVPMTEKMESLNAGVAGSILMFEIMRQRNG